MDTIPKRSIAAAPYRFILNKLESYLVFPVKNPDFYSVLSLLLSMLFLVISDRVTLIILLIVILLLDWFDGAAARRFHKIRKEGYMIDVLFDRISEALMFAPIIHTAVGKWFFGFYLINIVLTYYGIKSGKHFSLALRFFYLLFLIFNGNIAG